MPHLRRLRQRNQVALAAGGDFRCNVEALQVAHFRMFELEQEKTSRPLAMLSKRASSVAV